MVILHASEHNFAVAFDLCAIYTTDHSTHEADNYLHATGAQLIDECPPDHPIEGLQTGKLWATGDDIWLDVQNSTPETDGSAKRYVLVIDGSFY